MSERDEAADLEECESHLERYGNPSFIDVRLAITAKHYILALQSEREAREKMEAALQAIDGKLHRLGDYASDCTELRIRDTVIVTLVNDICGDVGESLAPPLNPSAKGDE
jgi:hypothetical protein